MLTHLLGWMAAALSVLLTWPQIRLSCVKGRTLGLSATACWLSFALNVCWFTYGVLLRDPVQVATNLVCGAGNAAILASLLAHQPSLRARRTLAATGWGAALLALSAGTAAVAAGVTGVTGAQAAVALGAVISGIGIFSCFPQVVSLLRDRTQDLSGMSPARWWLATGSSTLWTSYGFLQGQPAVWALSGFGLACNLTVCYLLTTSRRTVPAAASALSRRPVELALAA
jgi:uncharacterized protein with PQ loop repeat